MKITTNSNKELVSEIRAKLKENDNYCPCRVSKIPDNKCMCKEFREQVERKESGECHCGLYVVTDCEDSERGELCTD